MIITILGRQPEIGIAELERIYGSHDTRWFSDISAVVDTDEFDFNRLGGSQKAGRVTMEVAGNWQQVSRKILSEYCGVWANHEGKLTLGISAYGFDAPARDVQKTGIILKKKLRDYGVSVRLIPNAEPTLNSATSHHNKLGLASNKVELIVVRASSGKVIVAESIGAQNITAIAARDQARPKTDAFVGMLPPKLARIMVNLALGKKTNRRVLDPFCGTGVVLQESLLLDNDAYGTDLSQKMVDYSTVNLQWLTEKYNLSKKFAIELGDAMNHAWTGHIDAVVAETYLGQPFSAPPSPAKLTEVRGNCNHIISTFLSNIHQQLEPGTTLCLAVPAWRDTAGRFTHLPLINNLDRLGYSSASLTTVRPEQLLYYREDQVVARQLLILTRQ
jgi:tRNA G10  N-methylase Trm11